MTTSCRRNVIGLLAVAALVTTGLVQRAVAQQPAATRASQPAPKAATPPEVFCGTMQTGALCPTGTIGILKLSGPKVAPWLDAVNRYNQAMADITKQLKTDAKPLLTPAQMEELDRWFAEGLNPEINQLLASPNRSKSGSR